MLGLYDHVAVEADGIQCAARPTDAAELADLLRQHQPRWLIHCGPLAAAAWDPPSHEQRDEARTTTELAHLAAELGTALTVLSSDAVLCGPRMFHNEESQALAPGSQAACARAIEQTLAFAGALVVRTHAYGWSPVEAQAGFAERACEALSRAVRCMPTAGVTPRRSWPPTWPNYSSEPMNCGCAVCITSPAPNGPAPSVS